PRDEERGLLGLGEVHPCADPGGRRGSHGRNPRQPAAGAGREPKRPRRQSRRARSRQRRVRVAGPHAEGSVRVRAGQRVRAGDVLGLTGNSGNSSEPHLHFHVQDRPGLFGSARGLPVSFVGYRADGRHVARGTPVQSQFIRKEVRRGS
ncbi:MAG: M23 family metallopeptidase, partial [Actinobacteria bacterium]|nr:M23 family metallopeptidase [Actinomycetota bacterium]